MTDRTRTWIFVSVCIVCLGGAAAYIRHASLRPRAPRATAGTSATTWIAGQIPAKPYLLFRSTMNDDSFGRIGYVRLEALDGPRYLTPLSCQRIFFRADSGMCLTVEDDYLYPNNAYVFDAEFQLGPRIRLTGPPSRTRVSPDGRLAAITVFESGHSYSEEGFSTRTSLVDTRKEAILTDLEQFSIRKDGVPFRATDFNFWGVTFLADSRRFYATLQTAGKLYLILGDAAQMTAEVVRNDVECPSLSPGGDRLAFKKRVPVAAGISWQVAILDLATSRETVLDAETRSVDDQVDWLDDEHVLYHQPSSHGADIWTLRTDNSTPPRILLSDAYSPSVVRD